MFLIHFYTHPDRKFLQTGVWDGTNTTIFNSEISLLGSIPPEIDLCCRSIVRLNPFDPKDREHIQRHLYLLNNVDLKKASTLTVASVLAIRLHFSFFLILSESASNDDIQAYQDLFKKNIPLCWEAFKKIFETITFAPHPQWDFFPKYLSRFVHFFQAYCKVCDKTDRNRKHSEEMAMAVYDSLLKYVLSIPAERIGGNYFGPKMARELLLTMFTLFPNSEVLENLTRLTLVVSYDYLTCLSFQESKRPIQNLVLGLPRQLLDEKIENPDLSDELKKIILDDNLKREVLCGSIEILLVNLLIDTARTGIINNFGSEVNPAFEEREILHIMFIVANEVFHGHIIVLVYEGKIKVKYLLGDPSEFANLVKLGLRDAIKGKARALDIWEKLANKLELKTLIQEIKEFVKGEPITRVYIYPDGYLWNVPWSYIFQQLWRDEPYSFNNKLKVEPLIAVKLGARTAQTRRETNNAVFLAGWDYHAIKKKSPTTLRRGVIRNKEFSNLLGAREEIMRLDSIWNAEERSSITEFSCTASVALQKVEQLKKKSIFHLACHGAAISGNIPTLWLPGKEYKSYTALHYERILRVSWSMCEFVFFNACFGASSEPFIGGPALGLQEALSIAGVRCMVAPFWPIDDKTAMKFAIAFYDSLIHSSDYLEAFSIAQRSMLSHPSSDKLTLAAYNFYVL